MYIHTIGAVFSTQATFFNIDIGARLYCKQAQGKLKQFQLQYTIRSYLQPVAGVQIAGMAQKDASRKNSEGGGVRSESIGSLSPSPSPPYFFPPFVTLHHTSPTAQNRLALLPQAISL